MKRVLERESRGASLLKWYETEMKVLYILCLFLQQKVHETFHHQSTFILLPFYTFMRYCFCFFVSLYHVPPPTRCLCVCGKTRQGRYIVLWSMKGNNSIYFFISRTIRQASVWLFDAVNMILPLLSHCCIKFTFHNNTHRVCEWIFQLHLLENNFFCTCIAQTDDLYYIVLYFLPWIIDFVYMVAQVIKEINVI